MQPFFTPLQSAKGDETKFIGNFAQYETFASGRRGEEAKLADSATFDML